MSGIVEIRIPRETVNDDFVTVQEWFKQAGERVQARDTIVSVESSKAVLEIEADASGYLEIIHPAGTEVAIGEVIGRILADAPDARQAEPAAPSAADTGPATPGAALNISRKAQALIDEHAIDVATAFPDGGLVREADVIRYLQRAIDEPAPTPLDPAPAVATPQRAATAIGSAYAEKPRGMFADARQSAKDRGGRSVVWLAWNYFWRNWLLGHLARWAPRGVILPLHRLRGVKMGRDVFIDPSAIVETAFPENITIGNDVRIAAGAVIMSHIKPPHYLRETGLVPTVLKPVTLEDHCFIGVNAVVMPGVIVGRASVVTSGSVVVSDVPPYTMVQGNPARVIRRFPKPD